MSLNVNVIIRNVFFLAANQHIRLFSERSCDTEDWSNEAKKNSALNLNKFYFKMF